MSNEKPETGSMAWIDLTVKNAETVRDFYSAVVGWTSEEVDMGSNIFSTIIGAAF